MIAAAVLLAALGGAVPARAAVDAELQAKLEKVAEGFHGRVGIYARRLSDGAEAAVNADELFPTASLVKVPILMTLYDRVASSQVAFGAPLVYSSTRAYAEDDIVASFKDGVKTSLPKLAWLTAAYSDNTAALWCQELAGGGAAINAWLAAKGFEKTRVNSRTPGREADKAAYGWGQTTPREMARLFAGLREGGLLPRPAAEALYRVFSASYWTNEALSQIPPWVQAASKQGAVDHARSEVLLVSAPSGAYELAVMTKDQADGSWSLDNEGYRLLRAASAAAWGRFEPRSDWRPAEGWTRFAKPE